MAYRQARNVADIFMVSKLRLCSKTGKVTRGPRACPTHHTADAVFFYDYVLSTLKYDGVNVRASLLISFTYPFYR